MLKKINREYYHFHDNKTGFDFTLKYGAIGVCAAGRCWRLTSIINGVENVIACFMTIDDGHHYYNRCYGEGLWNDFFNEILPEANAMIAAMIGYTPQLEPNKTTNCLISGDTVVNAPPKPTPSKLASDKSNTEPSAALTIRTNKKANAAYWDAIDDVVFSCIKEFAQYSLNFDTKLVFDEDNDDENTTFCDLFGDGIVGEVRDIILKYLEENGAEFPFVNENM